MMPDQELNDLLDKFAKGQLSSEEAAGVKRKMMTDSEFRKQAEEHVRLVRSLQLFGKRERVRRILNDTNLDIPQENQEQVARPLIYRTWKKHWPTAAIAASVALFSVFGTLLITQFQEKQQTAQFIEAVRKVEQKQNQIINNMAETKEKTPVKPKAQPERYTGTGFLVSANGYVVTSHHVVRNADSVYIENAVYGPLKTAVVYNDIANDLAVLRIDNAAVKLSKLPYTISANEANLGEDVYTLGFPREDIVFGEGSISALTGYRQNPNSYQVSVPVNPGNSGGPLFNSKGELVGIISGVQTATSGAAFAIKSSVLLEALKSMPTDSTHASVTLPKSNSVRNLHKVDQVNRWKDNVFIVRVYDSQ